MCQSCNSASQRLRSLCCRGIPALQGRCKLSTDSLGCCRFRGHEDKIVTKELTRTRDRSQIARSTRIRPLSASTVPFARFASPRSRRARPPSAWRRGIRASSRQGLSAATRIFRPEEAGRKRRGRQLAEKWPLPIIPRPLWSLKQLGAPQRAAHGLYGPSAPASLPFARLGATSDRHSRTPAKSSTKARERRSSKPLFGYRRCCTSQGFEDSLGESSGLDGLDEQAASPGLPYHELAHVQPLA